MQSVWELTDAKIPGSFFEERVGQFLRLNFFHGQRGCCDFLSCLLLRLKIMTNTFIDKTVFPTNNQRLVAKMNFSNSKYNINLILQQQS